MLTIHTNSIFLQHDTGVGHPERAARMDFAMEGVRRAGNGVSVDPETPSHADGSRLIAKVHSADYARALDEACDSGADLFHSRDNPISAATSAAASAAVGVALTAASAVWEERTSTRAFVIARPPGHHAERTQAMGFCFFNTIAVVAEWLLERPSIERVFIFDWDVHHGNGTQHLFEEREEVFFLSMHRYPFYPGTGHPSEIGVGNGAGFTRNIPMQAGEGDAAYLRALEQIVIPAIDQFRPSAILVSAGFDAHRFDPLGGMKVSEEAYGEMTKRICEASERHCGGRLLSLLEGGYDPEGIAASVAEHVNELGETKSVE